MSDLLLHYLLYGPYSLFAHDTVYLKRYPVIPHPIGYVKKYLYLWKYIDQTRVP